VTNILRVLPTRWRQKSTGTDMEQNCVTVTLCINKGDIRTFNINNEEEKHNTMKRKKQRVGRKKQYDDEE